MRQAAIAGVAALGAVLFAGGAAMAEPAAKNVLTTYADIAHAGYEDSLVTARTLQAAVGRLLDTPTQETMLAARAAWIAARHPYQKTETFRFGNRVVDDWEGKVNAWPLDEGLIDYVAPQYGASSGENPLYTANVIANPDLKIGGKDIDAHTITPHLLADELQEAGDVEANVATGYHAIEFLLWGQDLNGTGPGNGDRPATDYDLANCTHGHCDRRAQYLRVVTDLLVGDLQWMTKQWAGDGETRANLLSGDPKAGLTAIFTGMGSLSYGELAGERMKLGLLTHDPEEEQDCFSDNTHNAHRDDIIGVADVYLGRYRRVDGSIVSGPSLSDLVKAADPHLDTQVRAALNATLDAAGAMMRRAETVEAYDQMLGAGNEEGNAVVNAVIGKLLGQTKAFEQAAAVLDLNAIRFEGSDSLGGMAGAQ